MFGECAFKECFRLREVVFEPDSQLRSIGSECFYGCRFKKVVIPRRVRSIGKKAFFCCGELSSLKFEKGSKLRRVKGSAFYATKLGRRGPKFPNGVTEDK